MTPLTKLAIPPGPRPKPGSSGALSPLPSYYVSPTGSRPHWPYHQVPGPGGTTRGPGSTWDLEKFRESSLYHQVHSESLGAPGFLPSPPLLSLKAPEPRNSRHPVYRKAGTGRPGVRGPRERPRWAADHRGPPRTPWNSSGHISGTVGRRRTGRTSLDSGRPGAAGRAVADPRWRTTGDRRAENPAHKRPNRGAGRATSRPDLLEVRGEPGSPGAPSPLPSFEEPWGGTAGPEPYRG